MLILVWKHWSEQAGWIRRILGTCWLLRGFQAALSCSFEQADMWDTIHHCLKSKYFQNRASYFSDAFSKMKAMWKGLIFVIWAKSFGNQFGDGKDFLIWVKETKLLECLLKWISSLLKLIHFPRAAASRDFINDLLLPEPIVFVLMHESIHCFLYHLV